MEYANCNTNDTQSIKYNRIIVKCFYAVNLSSSDHVNFIFANITSYATAVKE